MKPAALAAIFPTFGIRRTAELWRRPSRPPEDAAVVHALMEFASVMANSPTSVLQKLAESALELCRAGSAGISVAEEEGVDRGQKEGQFRGLRGASQS